MPTFKGQVTEEQLGHIVAYIKSLSGDGTDTASPSSGTSMNSGTTQPAADNTEGSN